MLYLKPITFGLVGSALHFGGAKSLSLRTSVPGNDTVRELSFTTPYPANVTKFDDFGLLQASKPIEQDLGGTVRYAPSINVASFGGDTGGLFTLSIKRASGQNLGVAASNITLYSSRGCACLKEMYFACTQIRTGQGIANLSISCNMTVEALRPGTKGGLDGVVASQEFSFTPDLQVTIALLSISSSMMKAQVTLAPALRYRVSRRSTDLNRINRVVGVIRGKLGASSPLVSSVADILGNLFSQLSDDVVKAVLDNVIYETGVVCLD
jgi:hypothetical protein